MTPPTKNVTHARPEWIRADTKEQAVTRQIEKIALVTGGAGFIGSNLCDRLISSGARVICLDNFQTGRAVNIQHLGRENHFELVEHDVIDSLPQWLRDGRIRFTHIYHLACAASPPHYQADPEHTLLTCVVGTRNLLRLAEESGARLLLSSTSEVYGDAEVHPQSEDYRGAVNCTGRAPATTKASAPPRPSRSTFCVLAEPTCASAHLQHLWPADAPRRWPNRLQSHLPGAERKRYHDLWLRIADPQLLYVDDLLEGLVRLMELDRAAGFPVNLGNPDELTIRELADLVVDMTRTRSRIVYRPLPEDDPRRRKPDIDRARQLLDWQPVVSLKDGLEFDDSMVRIRSVDRCGSRADPRAGGR